MAVVMPEEGFRRPERRDGVRVHTGFVTTLKEGVSQVRAHHVLVLILGTAALHGASTEGFDRLADYHLLKDIGLPAIGNLDRVVWFAILDGVGLVLGIGVLSLVKRRTHLNGQAHVARILRWIDVLLIVGVVVFGLSGAFWLAVLTMWMVGALRSVRQPIFDAWLNQGLDPKTRATINSMGSQSDAVGQAAGGPVLGLIGNASCRSLSWSPPCCGCRRCCCTRARSNVEPSARSRRLTRRSLWRNERATMCSGR